MHQLNQNFHISSKEITLEEKLSFFGRRSIKQNCFNEMINENSLCAEIKRSYLLRITSIKNQLTE